MWKTHGLLFYPGMWIVRRWTRSPYGHVAVLLNGMVWEAIAEGVSRHPFDPTGRDKKSIFVPLPPTCRLDHAPAAHKFLAAQIGKPYDWQADFFDVVGVLLGPRARLNIAGDDRWNCSRLAASALLAMGWEGENAADLQCPVSPGVLYKLVTMEKEEVRL